MAQASTQTAATFTGTLLKREYAAGPKVIQLVFREKGKNWLCVSTNLTTAKLVVGQTYRVEGEFKSLGDRSYIHEPQISPGRSRLFGLKRLALSVGVVLVVASMTAGAVHMVHGSLTPTSAEVPKKERTSGTKAAPIAPAQEAVPQAQPAPESAPAPPPPAPKPIVKKKTTPVVAAPVANPPAAVPDPIPPVTTPPAPVEDPAPVELPPTSTEPPVPTTLPADSTEETE